MIMLQPATSPSFAKSQKGKLLPVVKQLETASMVNNAIAVKKGCNNKAGECGIFLDGTWHTQGRVSHNCVVAAILMGTKELCVWKI